VAFIDTPGGRGRQSRVINSADDRPDERDVGELCHDLRQPVAALVQLAAASTAELAGPARERMAQISRETRRLCGMVQAVLAGPAVWEPVDLAGIAREVVQSVRVTYDGELDLSAPGPAPVIGQRAQLDRVLSNLIENAAHAGRGVVHVEVRTTDGRVRVSVDDDGPGLLRGAGGVSLGLVIVDRLVREHGGQDSVLGGTRVEMTLPAADTTGPRSGLRLVLCDDHRLFAESLAVVLQERGWEVLAVVDRPDAAVAAVTAYHPDVCVLDALFDGDAAAAVAAAGHMRETSPATRVVVLSGTDEPAVVGAAVTAGAAGRRWWTPSWPAARSCTARCRRTTRSGWCGT
jgi:CheY-like chemotaxis protein